MTRVQFGAQDLQFVPESTLEGISLDSNNQTAVDPDTGSVDEDLVLNVRYPSGSYSHGTGGTQFYVSDVDMDSSASVFVVFLSPLRYWILIWTRRKLMYRVMDARIL